MSAQALQPACAQPAEGTAVGPVCAPVSRAGGREAVRGMAMGQSHKALRAMVRVWDSGRCEKGNCGLFWTGRIPQCDLHS